MRISDWSSDVCSSDLVDIGLVVRNEQQLAAVGRPIDRMLVISAVGKLRHRTARDIGDEQMEMLVVVEPIGKTARGTITVTRGEWKSGEQGKSVTVREAHGGCRSIKKKEKLKNQNT